MPNITTVADLIAHLQTYPSNAVLKFCTSDSFGYGLTVSLDLEKMKLHKHKGEPLALEIVLNP